MTTLADALARSGADHGPGLLGLVTDNGRTVFEQTVGDPFTADDLVRIGSITKTYVAALVLQLAADGALSCADPVDRWLPGMIDDGDLITVEMLLRMRSGLPDYVDPPIGDERDLEPLRRYWSPEQLVRKAMASDDRKPPDTEFRYCNTDYILLGLIVEAATGQRAEAQLWQRIFEPLGLAATIFPNADPYLRGPHAKGYLRNAGTAIECTTLSLSESWTAGAIAASARDLARFFDGLFDGTLLDADSLAHLLDCTEVVDEHRSRGAGIVRHDFGGEVAHGHVGGVPGYTTIAMRTESGRTIVLCQNGIDMDNPLTTDTPFIQAALSRPGREHAGTSGARPTRGR